MTLEMEIKEMEIKENDSMDDVLDGSFASLDGGGTIPITKRRFRMRRTPEPAKMKVSVLGAPVQKTGYVLHPQKNSHLKKTAPKTGFGLRSNDSRPRQLWTTNR